MRYLIKFSYDGTAYSGFQSQKGLDTVQERLETALTKVNNNTRTTLTATGRTDKGVHALCQYGHSNISVNINEKKLKRIRGDYYSINFDYVTLHTKEKYIKNII